VLTHPARAQYNDANNEENFVQLLRLKLVEKMPRFDPHFVIDTGRNGVDDMRQASAATPAAPLPISVT
jgi:hypothetical protein